MIASLRHLRIVQAVQKTRSVTRAAEAFHLSQPAVTTALTGLEARLGFALFDRHPSGLDPTPAGAALCLRITRALSLLDPALADLSPRLVRTASFAQINALIAVAETESFSAGARRLGIAQPTVHRAVAVMEAEAGHSLFSRTAHGVIPTRLVRQLCLTAQLALSELDQAITDIADLSGQEAGRLVIGAMPLSRSALLGPAIARFRRAGRSVPIKIVEGPYAELLLGLRRGALDFLVGALRPDADGLVQERLFDDELAIVARPDHPALDKEVTMTILGQYPWVVAPEGTPARGHFQALFARAGQVAPVSLVETGSMELLADLVGQTDHFGFVSLRQARREVKKANLVHVSYRVPESVRAIGLTFRQNWHATRAQSEIADAIRTVALGPICD